MLDNNYYEQQIYDDNNSKAQLKYFLMGGIGLSLFAVAVVVLAAAFSDQQWVLLVLALIFGGVGIYLFIKKDEAYLEYEYVFSMGELEIAKIINNKKRKELCKIPCVDIEVFGKTTASNYNRYSSMPDAKKLSATFEKKESENIYFLVYNGAKGKLVINFSPDDEMLANIVKHLRVRIEI